MHKFKLDINNVHKFIVQQKNYHKFTLEQDNHHRFTINALDATPMIKLILDKIEYYSTTEIGSKERMLNEFDCLLKDLPESLRRFVGSYVYIMARLNGFMSYSSSSMLSSNAISRLHGRAEYLSTFALSMIVKVILRLRSVDMSYQSSMSYFIGIGMHSEDMLYSYDSSVNCKAYVKMSGNIQEEYRTSFRVILAAKDSGSSVYESHVNIDNGKTYQYKVRWLREYDCQLKDLPERLIDFCYKTTPDWQDILDYNTSWEDVVNNYHSWESLLVHGNKIGSDMNDNNTYL